MTPHSGMASFIELVADIWRVCSLSVVVDAFIPSPWEFHASQNYTDFVFKQTDKKREKEAGYINKWHVLVFTDCTHLYN